MRRVLQVLGFLLILTILQGCSSYKCYLPSCGEPNENPVITITEGEEKAIFENKRGLIWGGYQPGLMAADTSVVGVFYEDGKRGHTAYIKGLNPGKSIVYFVNRLGAGSERRAPEEHAYWLEYYDGSGTYFIVEVN